MCGSHFGSTSLTYISGKTAVALFLLLLDQRDFLHVVCSPVGQIRTACNAPHPGVPREGHRPPWKEQTGYRSAGSSPRRARMVPSQFFSPSPSLLLSSACGGCEHAHFSTAFHSLLVSLHYTYCVLLSAWNNASAACDPVALLVCFRTVSASVDLRCIVHMVSIDGYQVGRLMFLNTIFVFFGRKIFEIHLISTGKSCGSCDCLQERQFIDRSRVYPSNFMIVLNICRMRHVLRLKMDISNDDRNSRWCRL